MVDVAVVPDYVGALITYLRAQSDVTDLVPAERITGRLPDAEGMPRFHITFQKTGGGGNDRYVPLMRPRVDMRCYASTPYEAMRLWRTVHPFLVPQDRNLGFRAADCLVTDVNAELNPIGDVEPDTGWPRVFCSYRLTVMEVPTT